MSIDTDRPAITAQQYELLHGGGAEAAEIARPRLSRRRFLRRSMLAIWGVSTVAAVAGALDMLYPMLSGDFGSTQIVGKRAILKLLHQINFRRISLVFTTVLLQEHMLYIWPPKHNSCCMRMISPSSCNQSL